MLTNYIRIALRHLIRYKGYALINVFGLAIGIACCLLLMLYIQHESGYDQFHEKVDRIYRIADKNTPANQYPAAMVPSPWGPQMAQDFPEVEAMTRLRWPGGSWLISYEATSFYETKFVFTDSTFFQTFSYPLLIGDPEEVLRLPNSVVLTEESAKRYFGEENPIGKKLNGENIIEFTVTGVMANPSRNTDLEFDFLASYTSLYASGTYDEPLDIKRDGLYNFAIATFLLLKPNASPEAVQQKMPAFVERHLGEQIKALGNEVQPILVPLKSLHWQSVQSFITMLSILVLFILAIACINFINLATARAATRSKEVGLRKVVGARRSQLIGQYLGEALITAFISILFAVMLTEILLPAWNSLVHKDLIVPYDAAWFWGGLIGIAVLTGVMAGGYPALVLSGFQPVTVLKGAWKAGRFNTLSRKTLVTFQFVISIALIIWTFMASEQLGYMRQKNLGFDKDHTLVFMMANAEELQKFTTLKSELLNHPEVLAVSSGSRFPGYGVDDSYFHIEGLPTEEPLICDYLLADTNYFNLLGIDIILGNNFASDKMEASKDGACMVNEAMVRYMGWDDPIGKTVYVVGEAMHYSDRPYRIIGVVKDYHNRSMHTEIRPMVILPAQSGLFGAIRIDGRQTDQAMATINTVWQQVLPGHPNPGFTFMDQQFDQLYRNEADLKTVFNACGILSIIIAAMGLVGLTSFMTTQRSKEIGIRKVLGASITNIVVLLTRDFGKLMVVASIVALPVSYLLVDDYLQQFAYRIEIDPFALAGVCTAVFAVIWLSVGYLTVRAARSNPVETLRHE